jgi:segregation and condensation protein A
MIPGEPGPDPNGPAPNEPAPRSGAPILHLDGFDGPMDLLLDLAERQRLDLGHVSVVALTDQFVAALAGAGDSVPLERRAGWVIVAARLLHLRSRLLLPATAQDAAAAERAAATELRRIDEARAMRAAALWLDARPQLGSDMLGRPRVARDPRTESFMALMEACLVVLRPVPGTGAEVRDDAFPAPRTEFWDFAQALPHIRALLAAHPRGAELARFLPSATRAGPSNLQARAALASTLLAGLELARQGEATLEQDAPFGDIHLSRKAGGADEGRD